MYNVIRQIFMGWVSLLDNPEMISRMYTVQGEEDLRCQNLQNKFRVEAFSKGLPYTNQFGYNI